MLIVCSVLISFGFNRFNANNSIRSAITDYWVDATTPNTSTGVAERFAPSSGYFQILMTKFEALIHNDNGGVIYAKSYSGAIYIEDCVFSNCSVSSGFGGAIYTSISLGMVLNRVCAAHCQTNGTSYPQFALINTAWSSPVEFLLTSILKCSSEPQTRKQCFQIQKSILKLKGLNTSENHLYQLSIAQIYQAFSINISFSTFLTLTSVNTLALYMESTVASAHFDYINFVNISSVLSSQGLILNKNTTATFSESSFIMSGPFLIETQLSTSTFLNCIFGSFTYLGILPITVNLQTAMLTLQLHHLNVDECPGIPHPTVTQTIEATIENSPIITPEYSPIITPEYSPIITLGQTPEISPDPTFESTLSSTPEGLNDRTPEITQEQSLVDTLCYTPFTTPEYSPIITPEYSPIITPEYSPIITPEYSPIITPEPTPEISTDPTFESTLSSTPEGLNDRTPEITQEQSLADTLYFTPFTTPEYSPIITPEFTPIITHEQTPEISPDPTFERTLCSTHEMSIEETLKETLIFTPIFTISVTPEITQEITLGATPLETQTESPESTYSPTIPITPIIIVSSTFVPTLSETIIQSSNIMTESDEIEPDSSPFPTSTTESKSVTTVAAASVGGVTSVSLGGYFVVKYLETRSASVGISVEVNGEDSEGNDGELEEKGRGRGIGLLREKNLHHFINKD